MSTSGEIHCRASELIVWHHDNIKTPVLKESCQTLYKCIRGDPEVFLKYSDLNTKRNTIETEMTISNYIGLYIAQIPHDVYGISIVLLIIDLFTVPFQGRIQDFLLFFI